MLKVLFACVVSFSLLALVLSCSDSGGSNSNGGGGGGVSGGGGGGEPVSQTTWEYSIEYMNNGIACKDSYYYYLYSNNRLAYRFVTTVTSDMDYAITYTGTWENYEGEHGHTYHFNYTVDDEVNAWVDVNGSSMVVYTTETRDWTDADGLVYSSRYPYTVATFSRW